MRQRRRRRSPPRSRRGRPESSLLVGPEGIAEWVQAHDQVAWGELVPLAVKSIDRIAAGSELKELWVESDKDGDWTAEVQDLRARLTG